MSSRSHSAAGIIVRCIAHATSVPGGGRPASTRSRLLAGSGKRRTDWGRGGPNERYYLNRRPLLLPRTQLQRTRKSALPQRAKKKPTYRIFQVSKGEKRLMLETRGDVEILRTRAGRGLEASYRTPPITPARLA
jgi:hypothetical protein